MKRQSLQARVEQMAFPQHEGRATVAARVPQPTLVIHDEAGPAPIPEVLRAGHQPHRRQALARKPADSNQRLHEIRALGRALRLDAHLLPLAAAADFNMDTARGNPRQAGFQDPQQPPFEEPAPRAKRSLDQIARSRARHEDRVALATADAGAAVGQRLDADVGGGFSACGARRSR
jgi:hypothetical protein